jgi:hypothetical protein
MSSGNASKNISSGGEFNTIFNCSFVYNYIIINDALIKGYMGGNVYTNTGGPANFLCLPEDPTWGKYQDGIQGKLNPHFK